MKWFWANTTQVGFGEGAVREHLPKFVRPGSKVLCTFGFGSIDKNGARADVQGALDSLSCTVRWEGGIEPNPEYDRLVEIAAVARAFHPDLLLAVGGGSVLDGTKFVALAAGLDAGRDPWAIVARHEFSGTALPVASVLTLPATGSEWNCAFVISRRSIGQKRGQLFPDCAFPRFSLIDPLYTMTLPVRQLRNGVYDAIMHCVDNYLTPVSVPLLEHCYMAVVKELVAIGPDVVKEGSSLELHERLIMAASFALNGLFQLGKPGCAGIHKIGHQLTAKYGIDHGATLAICTKGCLESQFEARKAWFAASAEFVFGVHEGTVEQKARAFIDRLQRFIVALGLPTKVSDWPGAVVAPGDVEELVQGILTTAGAPAVGFQGSYTEADIRRILTEVVV
jgi:alcohol dehydrogenase YqhD (iron-dependent ADH family)